MPRLEILLRRLNINFDFILSNLESNEFEKILLIIDENERIQNLLEIISPNKNLDPFKNLFLEAIQKQENVQKKLEILAEEFKFELNHFKIKRQLLANFRS